MSSPIRMQHESSSSQGVHEFVVKSMVEARTVLVSKEIDDDLARDIYASLIIMEKQSTAAPITVIVNSPGGSADSGFGIYDMLRFVKAPIRSICAGLAASAAVPIFLAAPKGSRYSLPNSRFLLHQPSTRAIGQASDLQIQAREIRRIRERYNKIVSEATGQDFEKVGKDADRDFWLESDEALEYGLVDKIVAKHGEME